MKTKKFISSILFVIISILFVLFTELKNDISYYIKSDMPLGAGIVFGQLVNFAYLAYIISGIIIIIILAIKKRKSSMLITIITYILTVFIVFVFPATDLFIDMNFEINKVNRNKTIDLINNEEISDNMIGINEYAVPFRKTSCTRSMLVPKNDGCLKVMFFAHKDIFADKVIIYSSDDGGVKPYDFSHGLPSGMKYDFQNIKKLSENWYSAKIVK